MSAYINKLSLFSSKPANKSSASNENSTSNSWVIVGIEVAKFGVSIALTYIVTAQALKILKSAITNGNEKVDSKMKKDLAQRLKRPEIETMSFDSHEARILQDVVAADEINVTFADIGGLDSQLEDVRDNVVLPLRLWSLFKGQNALAISPTGVLLYGKPGTGKSLMAKAIAKESGATFVNIKASSLTEKWFGETDKLVSAMFKVGRKLAPTVIFVDEMETLLKKRGSSNDSCPALQSMQGVFMAEWDGIQVDNKDKKAPVVVLGATNRPMDLDKAFLRRMPVQIQTKAPDEIGRLAILKAHLKQEKLANDVNLGELAKQIVDFTGSDIRELVRMAKLQQMKCFLKETKEVLATNNNSPTALNTNSIEEIKMEYFLYAIQKCSVAGNDASSYGKELNKEEMFEKINGRLDAYNDAVADIATNRKEAAANPNSDHVSSD